jgi:uncharacterized membrane protein
MDAPLELIVSIYTNPNQAGEVLRDIRRAGREGTVSVRDAAVLVKDANGRVNTAPNDDVDAGRGALFGAVVGALVGLVAGPGGAVAGAVAGAATGGVTAAIVDMGFSDEQLRELRAAMPANSSALVVLIEHTWVEHLVHDLEQRHGRIFRSHQSSVTSNQ